MSTKRSVLVTGATGQQGGAVGEDVALMFEWFDRFGADADIAALRRDFSEVPWHSFVDWAREIGAFLNGRLLSPEVATRISLGFWFAIASKE